MHHFASENRLLCRELINVISGRRCLFLHRRKLHADNAGQLVATARSFRIVSLGIFARHLRHSSTLCAEVRCSSWKAHWRGRRVRACDRLARLYHWDNIQLWQPAAGSESHFHVQLSAAIDGWVNYWFSNLCGGYSSLQ